MTLSSSGKESRRRAARERRRQYDEELRVRRPWLFPTLVGGAIVMVVVAVYASMVLGLGPA